ncbi:MAG: hypothetical protein BECKG1743D_GA0114223_103544 [Candidatus Kentron sp. G]|nr:MAG: hypothetical protein BECKG1743F_GA0114225_100285 [Candidatus Kentron sp. G]VFM95881.1 MAG: hypothetical protein BECKG1743E_GA0114224_100244 [Candidatus Kentron sp. G]VFN02315.1 MAG: hypothetical protein BECKG1743D_GA0114223_103544 [Candidatus Kentron sp. G]
MSILSEFLTKLGVQDDFCIQLHLALSFVRLLCCNDSYIVHYAPVCARSQTSILYDLGFAIRVNYFLWGALHLGN